MIFLGMVVSLLLVILLRALVFVHEQEPQNWREYSLLFVLYAIVATLLSWVGAAIVGIVILSALWAIVEDRQILKWLMEKKIKF